MTHAAVAVSPESLAAFCNAVVASPNWLRRNAILDTAQLLYKKDEAQHGA